MDNDIKKMLKIVIKYDIVLMLAILALCFIVNIHYILIAESGLVIAVINFIMNSIVSNNIFIKKSGNKILLVLAAFARVILVCIVGFIFYRINQYYIIVYILGYTLQYVSLIIYGLKIKK